MARLSSGGVRLAVIGALVALVVVFVFDLLQSSPIMADVVEHHVGEKATLSWVDEGGSPQIAMLTVPSGYVGESRVPIVFNDLGWSYVDDGRLSLYWYLFAAAAGLLIGGPVAHSLRKRPYSEAPIRQVTIGSGV